jgi:hypothetical protein
LACARYSCQADGSDSGDAGVSIPSLAGLSAQQQVGVAAGMLGAAMIFQGLSELANQQQQPAPAQSAPPPQAVASPPPPPPPQVTVPPQSPAAIQDASLDPAQLRLLGLSSASGVGSRTTYSAPAPPPPDSVAAQKNALLGELRPLDGQAPQPAPQFGSAADQLCQAAGQPAGCLSGDIAAPPSSPVGPAGPAAASGPAGLNGPAERMSAAARAPFDTAGPPGAENGGTPPISVSDTPAVTVSSPNAKVALLSPPPLPPPANTQIVAPPPAELRGSLQAENKNLQGDACIRLVALRKQLEGLRASVERMQGIHEKSEEDRAEFEKQIGETTKDAWKHLADGLSSLVEADIDSKIEKLNEDAIGAINKRINAAGASDAIGAMHGDGVYFQMIVKERQKFKWDQDYVMRYIDTFSTSLDAADLTKEHDFGKRALNGSNMILSTLLGDPVFKDLIDLADTSKVLPFNTLANLYVNAITDDLSQWESYTALDNLNHADDKYLAASTSLQKNIQTTVGRIKAAQAELANSSRSCPSGL